jgi:acid phosphatase type 7
MQRREFLQVTGMSIAATSILQAAGTLMGAGEAATQPEALPLAPAVEAKIRTGPFLQDPAADGMTVMWMTTVPGYGMVEYGPTEQLGSRAQADVDGLVQANNVLHRVRLGGLSAGARYFYKVVFQPTPTFQSHRVVFDPAITSEVKSFVTRDPAAKSVRFVMFNDLHDNVAQWRQLHSYVATEKFDFAFLNGDVTNMMQDEKQMVGNFLDPCTEFFGGTMPFLYARGNHEVRGGYAREMKRYLSLPGGEYHYAFTQGPARFVVLDSGEDKEDNHPEYSGLCAFDAYRSMQQKFLQTEIRSEAWKSARWRIVLFHIPGFYSNGWHGPQEVKSKWHTLLEEGRADLFMAGHTHHYTVAKADASAGHSYPIIIGGGPKMGKGTVTTVDVDMEHIRMKMIRDDGVQVGELVV